MKSRAGFGRVSFTRTWFLPVLAAIACCAASLETAGITSHWQRKPGSVSLEVSAVFSGGKRTVSGMDVIITNPGDSAVTVDWDTCSMALLSGRTERIIHTGVMYLISAMPQASTTIPPGEYITESIWPANLATWRRPLFWGLLGEPTWIREKIDVPNSGGTLGLFLTWSDATGKHDGMWTWTIQPDLRKGRPWDTMTWIYVIGGVLLLRLISSWASDFE